MKQIHWLANLIDSNSTITVEVRSQFAEYVYFVPKIIITKRDKKTIQTTSQIVQLLTDHKPFKNESRLVINGWKRCSKVLEATLPFMLKKRQHARYITHLARLHKQINLFKSYTALDIITELQELNRKTDRTTLLDVVIDDSYKKLAST